MSIAQQQQQEQAPSYVYCTCGERLAVTSITATQHFTKLVVAPCACQVERINREISTVINSVTDELSQLL